MLNEPGKVGETGEVRGSSCSEVGLRQLRGGPCVLLKEAFLVDALLISTRMASAFHTRAVRGSLTTTFEVRTLDLWERKVPQRRRQGSLASGDCHPQTTTALYDQTNAMEGATCESPSPRSWGRGL